ncbi:MAG: ABC transporter substrate-binding protein, partial [bacterium]|nr:ABC transporter substrate-binding protein [bacterium]
MPTGAMLRIAALSSPADTLNPAATTGQLEYAVLFHVYDSLVLQKDGEFVLQLAESIEPNADATEWTITLIEGARFHDGRPVTAGDVAYSLGLFAASPNFGQNYAAVDLEGSTV